MDLKSLTKLKLEEKTNNNYLSDIIEAIDSNASIIWKIRLENTKQYSESILFRESLMFKDVYNFEHGSNEFAILRVLVFKGKDIAVMQKEGDTSSWKFTFIKKKYRQKFFQFLFDVEKEFEGYHFEDKSLKKETQHKSSYVEIEMIEGKPFIVKFLRSKLLLKVDRPKRAFIKGNLSECEIIDWIDEDKSSNLTHYVTIKKNNIVESINIELLAFEIK